MKSTTEMSQWRVSKQLVNGLANIPKVDSKWVETRHKVYGII